MARRSELVSFLTRDAVPWKPWKNSQGTTRELAIEPPGVDFGREKFLWRISSAMIQQNCDFSSFPGYQRILGLCEGKELVLKLPNAEMAALRPGETFEFLGATAVHAEVPRGPVTDFGVIFDPHKVRASLNVLKFKQAPRSFTLQGRNVFFFGVSGKVVASVYPGELIHGLEPGDALRVHELKNEERVILLEPKATNSLLFAVELSF